MGFLLMAAPRVASDLVGAVWPAAHPGGDPLLYGHVELQPKGAFEARSVQTFRLVYTVGRYGIDDTGGIAVMFRFFGDQGDLQTSDPTGYNYVSAHTDTGARIRLNYGTTAGHRPWFRSEEHTSELQSLMRNSYAVFCLKTKLQPTHGSTNLGPHHD